MAESAPARADIMLEAFAAAYALIAHADGEVAGSERRRILAIARETPALEAASHEDLVNEIGEHEANFRLDPEVAQQIAWEKLEPVAGQHRAAMLVFNACRELIPADGVIHPSEYRMLTDIRERLGLTDLGPA